VSLRLGSLILTKSLSLALCIFDFAKSEVAGLIGVAEALAPVRFDGWDASGQPVGRPIRSPFVRCLATEEKQSGNTNPESCSYWLYWARC